MPLTQTVVITGATGKMGAFLRPRLARQGRLLRLLDLVQPEKIEDGEEVWLSSITDPAALAKAFAGADAVIHLGGQSREAGIDSILMNNAYGTYCVLEAARHCGVPRVVLASSHHAAGFYERGAASPTGLPATAPGRPDTLYGWSKAAAEAMGSLYADRFGLEIICVRIGACVPEPGDLRMLALWLSPDDCGRLFEACLAAQAPGFRTIWGVSRNTRGFLSLLEAEALGYHAKDDSEPFAQRLIAAFGEPDYTNDPVVRRIGGEWCDIPLGEPY